MESSQFSAVALGRLDLLHDLFHHLLRHDGGESLEEGRHVLVGEGSLVGDTLTTRLEDE